MKAQAIVRLSSPSKKHIKIMLQALKPETKTTPTHRSKVEIKGERKNLILRFEAKDTSALRASINSYLRWIALVIDTCSVLESL